MARYLPLNPLGPAGVNRDSLYPFLSRTTEWLVWTTIDLPLRVPLHIYLEFDVCLSVHRSISVKKGTN